MMAVHFSAQRWMLAIAASLSALALWMLMADPAFAQAAGSFGDYTCSDGKASGTLYDVGSNCPTTLEFSNVFSFLVCNMERISSELLGQMYCGILDFAIPAVGATLTLAVMIFGMAFTSGAVPFTARDLQLFLLKVALVWTFATQSDYLIGIGYNFLVTSMREGIEIVLEALFKQSNNQAVLNAAASSGGPKVYAYLDAFLAQTIQFATDSTGANWNDKTKNPCENAVFAVIGAMAVVFPPLFYLSLALLFKIGMTFIRAVFGYVYAIMALAFMLTMAPLFLCFALFRQTQGLFNKYLGYLASFTLQMVIVFAFLGAIVSIDISHITSSLKDIIVPYDKVRESTRYIFPWQYCTVCEDFRAVHKDTGAEITGYKDFLEHGKLQCKSKNPLEPFTSVSPQNSDGKSNKMAQNNLMRFTATALISLFVLAYIVDAVLTRIPAIAQFIAGGMGGYYAPQLGGSSNNALAGRSALDMPGGHLLEAAERGFTDGYADAMRDPNGGKTPGAVAAGFREGAVRMLFGDAARDPKIVNRITGNEGNDPGLVGSFMRFLASPGE